MKTNTRWTMLSVATAMGATLIGGPAIPIAHAQNGSRDAAIGAGAITAYGLLRGNRTVGILGALGTAFAYKKYKNAKNNDRRQNIGQVFGNYPIHDQNHNRYSRNTYFNSGQTYYNGFGNAIAPQNIGQIFGNVPVQDANRNRYGNNTYFDSGNTYYDQNGKRISFKNVGHIFGNKPVHDSRRNRYNGNTNFDPGANYYDPYGNVITY